MVREEQVRGGVGVSFSCLLASTFDRYAIGRLRLVRAGHQSTTGEQTSLALIYTATIASLSLSLSRRATVITLMRC